MMRLLMIRLAEAGVATCAAIHDGFLFECDAREVDDVLVTVKAVMDRCAVDLIGATTPLSTRFSAGQKAIRRARPGSGSSTTRSGSD